MREEVESLRSQLSALQEEGFVREIEIEKLTSEREAFAQEAESSRHEVTDLKERLAFAQREAASSHSHAQSQTLQADARDHEIENLRRELREAREAQSRAERLLADQQRSQEPATAKESLVSPRPTKNKAENIKRSAEANKLPYPHKVRLIDCASFVNEC